MGTLTPGVSFAKRTGEGGRVHGKRSGRGRSADTRFAEIWESWAMTKFHNWKELEPLARLIDPDYWRRLDTYTRRIKLSDEAHDSYVTEYLERYPRAPISVSLEAAERIISAGYSKTRGDEARQSFDAAISC